MATKAKGIRLSSQLDDEITHESRTRGKSWSAITAELLGEGIRMRKAPGIFFVDGPTGRRAVVAGTGLDVWEVIATWWDTGKSYEGLRRSYPWLSEAQLRAALAYYQIYPVEISARLEREAEWTPERVQREFPFSRARNS
jgi:uncharacterized protein (DUF433 family)